MSEARLADELERLATDLRVERHGQPHMAVTVLLYPDAPATVLLVDSDGDPAYDVTNVQPLEPTEDGPSGGKRVPTEDLRRAGYAIDDALLGMAMFRRERDGEMRNFIRAHMQTAWERRQMEPIKRALERADYEAANPAICEFCTHRYTERGLSRHQRSCWKNPDAERYGPDGWEDPILQDGRIIGVQRRKINMTPCGRCPDSQGRHRDGSGPCRAQGCNCKRFVPPVDLVSSPPLPSR